MPDTGGRPRTTGIVIEGQGLGARDVISRAQLAEKVGVDSVWMVQLPSIRDTGNMLTAIAVSTDRVTVGAGILPFYTRPPVMMAQTAATIDELSGGRFVLGVGVGHKLTAEWTLGMPLSRPVDLMREYMQVVTGLLHDGEAHLDGTYYRAHAVYAAPRRPGLSAYLGVLGPRMCELAGEVADGLLLWMCPASYVRDVAIPRLRKGLARSGRDLADFPVTVLVPASVSDDRAADRELLRKYLSTYSRVPNYRAMYVASGYESALRGGEIGDELLDNVGVIGGHDDLRRTIADYHEAGATDVIITPMAAAHYDDGLWRRTAEAVVG
ncbi:MAG TPA: LLM class flavin-dependent oxidoreductase [Pseudonocardiaceae bacterium]